MRLTIRTIAIILAALFTAIPYTQAKQLNDKLANRPYADLRPWHLGFSIGMHTEDVTFSHNGLPTELGETWFMEQPSFSPGFSVNALLELRLNTYFSVRFSPGMYFGNRVIKMIDTTNGNRQSQNLKSTFVVLPVDLKFASQRFRNLRPYVTTGIMPAFDVAKRRSEFLQFNTSDMYLTVGFGVDFYMPYFKFIPELKFCFGLTDVLRHKRPDLADDPDKMKYTMALDKATSQMVVLTFYFE
ncbi:MAG: PorT family protein [Muribaculaceae bacterium]|nr:PorT family protein [Muribaculaceae bacterium]